MTAPTSTSAATNPSTVDDDAIRADRRRRLFDAMAAHDLDVLVLGRPAEVTFASGARQLWTAGSRPFGATCVAVRSTGHTHLLSVSDDNVPIEVGHADLYGLHWNPAVLAEELAAIPGLREARRVGTSSSSPTFGRMLAALAPEAELVDAAPALWEARTPKSAAEVERIRDAIAIARIGLAAMDAALVPGATERGLRAACLEALARAGAPTAPTEGVACATPTTGPVALRRLDRTEPIAAGQLVVLDPGAFYRGYEGGVGRTRAVGGWTEDQRALAGRAAAAKDAAITACRPGATGADLAAAWTATGEPLPPVPLATGVGLGMEPPVIDPGAGVGAGAVLAAGTVLAVSAWVTATGVGGVFERDLVLVGDDGPVVLTEDEA
ncbi:M24 family metallopeptidase [Aquihabitans sp. McL0605]|uniref:M24 family metallopeptidase n=1 Tax=Aquihabitans sp. McL0605 TaxID=3415671 RepID=UPI003CE89542